jgi:hypothetical protein
MWLNSKEQKEICIQTGSAVIADSCSFSLFPLMHSGTKFSIPFQKALCVIEYVCLRTKTTVSGVLEVAVSSIKLRFLYVLGSIKDCTVHVFRPGHSQQNASTNWNKDCQMCMGYNRTLVTMHHPPFLPPALSVAATTALLVLTTLPPTPPHTNLRCEVWKIGLSL